MKKTLENTFQKVKSRQQEKKKPKNPRSISRMGSLLGLGFGLIVSFNVGLYLYERNVEGVRLSRLEVLASQRAELAGEAAEAYIDNVWKTIEMYTSKPALNVAMAIGDINALENFKAEIGKRLHGVVAVRFIAAGEARLDQDVFPPIRFSELDMIRSALLREELYPEAAKINDRWVLTFVAPIPFDENQRAIGTMILTLFVDELQRLTLMEKASLGRLQLLQKFGAREALVVFSVGGGAEGREMVSPISNSYWHIGFKGSQGLKELARINLRNTGFAIIALMAVIVFVMAVAGRLLGIWLERSKEKAQMEAAGVPGQAAGDGSSLMDPLYQSVDILDIDIDQDNENLLGLDEVKTTKQEVLASLPDEPSEAEMLEDEGNVVPDVVFRAYDIRGLAKTQITKELARSVGQALGSEAIDSGQNCLIVARDARLSSPEITEWLIRGILNAGCNVLNIGTVPTPLLYFATCTLQESQSGVMVTASHSPAEHNGFKVVMNGEALSDGEIKGIRRRILKKDLYEGTGEERRQDIVATYVDTIFSDVALAGDISLVIDAGNGVTGVVAPKLFEELGCNVTPLFCDLDGSFPNRSPDPSEEGCLIPLINKIKEVGADLGVAFDGDGDRVLVVTSTGKIIWPDQLLMLFAKDIVSRNPGADVVFDVKSTRHLAACITSYGGRPIMWKTGHAPMKQKMLETSALVGGEYSGHIFIKDRWFGFDDGMYAVARLIEILSLQGETLDMLFSEFPSSPSTPEILIPVPEESKFAIVKKLVETGDFSGGRITDIDGLRVEYPFGWGLVRASNTSANLTLRFEGDDDEVLHKLKEIFALELKKVEPSLVINWKN